MPKKKLTHPFISNHDKPAKRIEYYDAVVDGLLIRITKKGTKTFALAYGRKGKRYTIGRFPSIGLAQARDIAKKLKVDIALGKDPQAEKIALRHKPQELTVNDLAETFKEKHLPNLKQSTADDYKRRIDKVIKPALGKLEIENVQRYHVIELLENIAEGNGKRDGAPIQSNRVRAVMSSMFNFGINRGIADNNPVQSIKPLGKERQRRRVYSEDEIRKLWEQFELLAEPYCSLFKMLLVTGQRSGETRMMRWDEINDGIWTIPKEKTKANRLQKLPLPPLALDILDEIKLITGNSDYVFESPVKANKPINWLQNRSSDVKKGSKIPDFRLHDLRRTAASYMAGLGVDRTVLGKVLNHKGLSGDNQVTAIYDRFSYMNEKRQALLKWNRILDKILHGKTETNVLKMV